MVGPRSVAVGERGDWSALGGLVIPVSEDHGRSGEVPGTAHVAGPGLVGMARSRWRGGGGQGEQGRMPQGSGEWHEGPLT
jgi:hypothetical protein